MSEPILPLYEAATQATNEFLAAKKKMDDAQAALFAAMPEHVEFSTVAEPPPLIKRVGNQIIAVVKPTLHAPYVPASEPTT